MTKAEYLVEVNDLLHRLDVWHFSAEELCRVGRRHQSGATLYAPPRTLHPFIIPTIVRLERVRRELGHGIRVMSGYRSAAYNRAVGGSDGSMHMSFNAVDLVPLGDGTINGLYNALLALPGARRTFGLKMYPDRGFVHFDTRGIVSGAPAWIP